MPASAALTLISSLLLVVQFSTANNLKVVISNARLPTARAPGAIGYDGDDSIYILGGRYRGAYWSTEILKFSVSKESVELIGRMVDSELGSGIWAGDGDLFYFGGSDASGSGRVHDEVWALHVTDPSNFTVVNKLFEECYWTTSIWDQDSNGYIIGGHSFDVGTLNSIIKFNKITNEVSLVAQMPSGRQMASSVWDSDYSVAYIFGGRTSSSGGYLNDILRFDPVSESVSKLEATLPVQIAFSSAINAGNYIYVLGGTTNVANDWPSVVRFDPLTNEVLTVTVDGFPDKLYSAGCVYVEKLNRIYIFGGYAVDSYKHEIMYIDLDGEDLPSTSTAQTESSEATTPNVNPTTTTTRRPVDPPVDCSDEEDDTLFPNPFCCESFYQCDNGQTILHQCPDFLQFSPTEGRCEHPEIVKCGIIYQ